MNNGEKNKKINFSHNDINTDLYNLYKDSSYLAVDTEAMGCLLYTSPSPRDED